MSIRRIIEQQVDNPAQREAFRQSLIDAGEWDSCMGCHDFHGNHLMTTREKLSEVIPPGQILAYFRGGVSPYSPDKKFTARREPLP